MEKRRRPQKSCMGIAQARARLAKRQKKHPILICWIFIAALLSIRAPAILVPTPRGLESDYDWPISDYERGYSTKPKPRERYIVQPTLKRLIRDLRRPAAREDALQCLLSRIDDIALRGWVIEQIREDRINRLAINVRSGLPDTAVVASWQAELDVENTAVYKAINNSLQTDQSPSP